MDVPSHALHESALAHDYAVANDTAQADRLFEATWRAAYPALRSRAQRLVGDHPDRTDDLLGSAAIKALKFMRRSPQKLTDPEVFLFVVLRHVFLDSVRRRARDKGMFDDAVDIADHTGAVDIGSDQVPEDWNDRHAQLRLVAVALRSMPHEQQRLFALRFLDQLPYSAIAERLGINEPLARKRVQVLRGRLLAALEQDAIHAPALPALDVKSVRQRTPNAGYAPAPHDIARPMQS